MATYVNDLRLTELATGEGSGTWGTTTNTSLELLGEAMGVGAEAIANASTHTITMADGATDQFRSTFLRLTGGGQACTVTLAPNTVSHFWIMRNETAAALTLTQGSGANVVIAAGQTKLVCTDGAGSGAIVYEVDDLELAGNLIVGDNVSLLSDSSVLTFGADGDTTLTHTDGSGLTLNSTNKIMFNDASQFIQGSSATVLSLGATDEIDLTATLIDINGNADVSGTVTATGTSVFASLDISGDIDVDGTTNLDVVDIDGAVDMASTLTSGAHLINASSSAFGGSSVQGFNTDFLVDSGQGFSRHNSYHTGGSNHQFLVNEASSTTNAVAFSIAKDKTATFTGGAVFNEDSADVDFRVESTNNANMLFVDGGDDAVVIGHNASRKTLFNTTATAALQVEGTSGNTAAMSIARNSNDDNGPQFVLAKSNGTSGGAVTVVTDDALLGRISFQGADGTQTVEGARVEAFVDGTPGADDMPGRLVFSTTADGASSPTTRMTIDNSGQVGIGTDPAAKLDIMATGATQFYIRNTDSSSQENAIVSLRTGGYSNLNLDGTNVVFKNSGTELARVDGDGIKMASGKGIKFDAYGSGNVLHDYEEGTFTPTLSGGSTAGTFTPGSGTTGRYVKIGKICKADVSIRNATVSGAGGTFKINGLPFNAFDNAVFSITSVLMMHNVTFNSDYIQAFYMLNNILYGIQSISSSAWQDWAITNSSGIYIQLTIVFEVDE